MFNKFAEFFCIEKIQIKNSNETSLNLSKELICLLEQFEGTSFLKGLYSIHKHEDLDKWTQVIEGSYPEFTGRIICFGYDWLGRQFAIDNQRKKNGKEMILMFEPGTADVLEIPCDIIEFHETEIVEYHDACLASSFFNEWMSNAKDNSIEFGKCVGYKTPLFLGGEDAVLNLELSDMDVYWTLCSQLINKTR